MQTSTHKLTNLANPQVIKQANNKESSKEIPKIS